MYFLFEGNAEFNTSSENKVTRNSGPFLSAAKTNLNVYILPQTTLASKDSYKLQHPQDLTYPRSSQGTFENTYEPHPQGSHSASGLCVPAPALAVATSGATCWEHGQERNPEFFRYRLGILTPRTRSEVLPGFMEFWRRGSESVPRDWGTGRGWPGKV